MGTKKSEKILKNREKNLQFFGVKQSKIRWTDLEIKFIKGKTLTKIWEPKNLERYIKIEKKFAIFWCKAIKNPMDGSRDKIHQR